ncbi:MutS domain V protein [Oesophagostomum dentatum]|uniref:DNA mismatch repair protein n=1 Tax=Oesophagostomum dentatum TaxID=61180 RepID=A0A0B1TTD1_OESDE|nr:MutS domain V protein [Oesophagostomum dentatum]
MATRGCKDTRTLKRVNNDDDSSPISRAKGAVKRRRVIVSSDEEDNLDENLLTNESSTPLRAAAEISTPKTALRQLKECSTPLSTVQAESFIDSFRICDDDLNVSAASIDTLDRTIYHVDSKSRSLKNESQLAMEQNEKFTHETLPFLKPDKIRDAQGHRPDDDNYDPTTLYVPADFLKEQSPGHKQWWSIKSKNYDTLLLFKVGKFYELYHMDAVVAVDCLGLTFMRGAFAHCGFPEAAYGKFADQLVSRGYKVARIEQTETPQQLEERNRKQSGGKDKVVRREVCRVTTNGTRTYSVLDGCNLYGGETDNGETQSKFLLSIKELIEGHLSTYGVCLVDTSVGKFFLAEFRDDDYSSYLRTIIANFTPVQVLFERGHLSSHCKTILNGMLSTVQKEGLTPRKQFLEADETVKILCDEKYLGANQGEWPEVLRDMLDPDSVVAKPSLSSTLALSALGAVLHYLQRCLIDVDMVTMRDFNLLKPMDEDVQRKTNEREWMNRQMILDGITLDNLNLVPGDHSDVQSASLSLYSTVNKCQTPFGKRLLRQWICAPTCDLNELKARQEAVEWLMSPPAARFAEKASELLRKVPDLERLLQKIHTLGLKYRAESHPDSRAVMFEAANYNKRKIKDLINTLAGFQSCYDLTILYDKFRQDLEGCPLIDQFLGNDDKLDLQSHLEHFSKSFNHSIAEKEGTIVPQKGQDKEYDNACQMVEQALKEVEVYRKDQEDRLRCKVFAEYLSCILAVAKIDFKWKLLKTSTFPGVMILNLAERLSILVICTYEDWLLKILIQGFGRYTTDELNELIEAVFKAEAYKDQQRSDATRRVFADFDSRRQVWSTVLNRIAQFDVLLSLARYCQTCGLPVCRPEFVGSSEKPFLVIEEGYHPCLAVKLSNSEGASACTYIANDSHLGGDSPPAVLLTGPNMGGKSTLMRQVAVLTVLAHMGSLVPARSMRLSPVDRIFTRIGANDRLICGQSTFYVELKETLIILRNATKHSLVLIDELGRGTSTFDGTAIASAVLTDLSRRIQCRSFFSTHYHSLCRSASVNPNITLAHMACMVENEDEANPTEESVTFLYRLTTGVCPKSYGFYAARLAGVRAEVVKEAYDASSLLFDSVNRKKMAIAAVKAASRAGGSVEQLREMIEAL